jgi:tRNA(adenine34) deaminase
MTQADDTYYMELALGEARQAEELGEVPVGAILVDPGGRVIAAGGNRSISLCDSSAHAEMMVLRRAGEFVQNYRFPGMTLYVTLEPCVMCAGALVLARIDRLVFGAEDPRAGGVVSLYNVGSDGRLNHQFQVTGGVLAAECSQILKDFFRARRLKS